MRNKCEIGTLVQDREMWKRKIKYTLGIKCVLGNVNSVQHRNGIKTFI